MDVHFDITHQQDTKHFRHLQRFPYPFPTIDVILSLDGISLRAREWALVQHPEMNCPWRHRTDKAKDFIGKGPLGGQQQGKGTQENCSASRLAVSGFMVVQLAFWVAIVSGQSSCFCLHLVQLRALPGASFSQDGFQREDFWGDWQDILWTGVSSASWPLLDFPWVGCGSFTGFVFFWSILRWETEAKVLRCPAKAGSFSQWLPNNFLRCWLDSSLLVFLVNKAAQSVFLCLASLTWREFWVLSVLWSLSLVYFYYFWIQSFKGERETLIK